MYNEIKVDLQDPALAGGEIMVYDVTGKVVMREPITRSGLSSFEIGQAGIYVVQVIDRTNLLLKTNKVVIQ